MPQLDYAKARAAGLTDQQIADGIRLQRSKGIDVWLDQAEVDSVRSGRPSVQNSGNDLTKHAPFPPVLDRALSLAPAVLATGGAMVGTSLGPAGNIAGAFLGGAIGRGLQGNTTPAQRYGEGGLQAAYELGGMGLGAVAGKVATGITRRALQPSSAILKETPDVAGTVLRERAPITLGGEATTQLASSQATAAREAALRAASSRGFRSSISTVLAPARRFIQTSGAPPSVRRALSDKLADIAKSGRRLDPVKLQEIKDYWQGVAKSAYGNPDAAISADFAKAIAAGAQRELERIPGMRAMNAKILELSNAAEAVGTAARRNPPPLSVNPSTWPIVSEAMGPAAQGSLARGLTKFPRVTRYTPRFGGTALSESGKQR